MNKLQTKNKSSVMKRIRKYRMLYLICIPALGYLIINNYVPMYGLVIAFKNYRYDTGIWNSPWAGWKNFRFLFQSKDIWLITRNTLLYNLVFIVLGTVCAVSVAILLGEIRSPHLRKTCQTLILLPYLLSMVVISYVVYGFLSPDMGFLNSVLTRLGRDGIAWYASPVYWPFILVFVYLWHRVGYNCIIYYAAIVGIDRGLYEAAEIDGATGWQKVRYITLPGLKPTIITMTLLALGNIFYSDFGLFYQVTLNSGALFNVTTTIDTYVYRGLIQNPNISMSAATGFYQSMVGFVLVLLANLVTRRLSRENALF